MCPHTAMRRTTSTPAGSMFVSAEDGVIRP
jgi:hypothetical protein